MSSSPRLACSAAILLALALALAPGAARALAARSSAADEAIRVGDVLARKGLYAEAIQQLERAAQLAGGRSAKLDVALARAYAGAGQRDQAQAAAKAALAAGASGLVEKEAQILRCENRPSASADAAAALNPRARGVTQPEVIWKDRPDVPRRITRKRADVPLNLALKRGPVSLAIEFVVDEQGCVSDAHVTQATGTGLDQAMLAAVERWVYRPATLAGRPVRVRQAMTAKFELRAIPARWLH